MPLNLISTFSVQKGNAMINFKTQVIILEATCEVKTRTKIFTF